MTDTERLEWYFGQDRFVVRPIKDPWIPVGNYYLYEHINQDTKLIPRFHNLAGGDIWPSFREAIDHAFCDAESDDAEA